MTIETSIKDFEDQILQSAQVTKIIKHKSPDHKDYFTVHIDDPKGKSMVFENIGEILLFQCLQRSGQLEEFASSLFGSDINSFLKNGYMIKEYHMSPDGVSYTVTVHRINASHILVGVSEADLAKCLAVTDPGELKLHNVMHLGFHDAIDQGYKVISYKVHESGNDVYSAQVKLGDKIKSFGSISAKHLAEALGVATGALQESFGEHLTATEAIKRSSSFSPRSKVTLQEAVKAGGKIVSSHAHEGNDNLWTVQVKAADGTKHTFSTVTKKHLEALPGFSASAIAADEE